MQEIVVDEHIRSFLETGGEYAALVRAGSSGSRLKFGFAAALTHATPKWIAIHHDS